MQYKRALYDAVQQSVLNICRFVQSLNKFHKSFLTFRTPRSQYMASNILHHSTHAGYPWYGIYSKPKSLSKVRWTKQFSVPTFTLSYHSLSKKVAI